MVRNWFECVNTRCGHHYPQGGDNAPSVNQCPLCGSPGRPERAVEGWCKGADGETVEVDL